MRRGKILLNNNIRAVLLNERRMAKRTGDEVSLSLGLAKSAIAQLENGIRKTIDSVLLVRLIANLRNISSQEAEDYIKENILIFGSYDYNKLEEVEQMSSDKKEVTLIVQNINKFKKDYYNIKYSFLKEEYKNQVFSIGK